jgi:hypothetical protein
MSYTEQPARAELDTPAWSIDLEREPSGPGVIDSPHVIDTAQESAALWGADLVRQYQARWEELQLRFVDDPRAAAGQAAQLIDEAVESLTGALAGQQESLAGWQRGDSGDTEELRTALQRYRDFLDRLLGM